MFGLEIPKSDKFIQIIVNHHRSIWIHSNTHIRADLCDDEISRCNWVSLVATQRSIPITLSRIHFSQLRMGNKYFRFLLFKGDSFASRKQPDLFMASQ